MPDLPNLEHLVPRAPSPRDRWRWGDVVTTSPLTVHLENDPAGVNVPATNPGGAPVAGLRVLCLLRAGQGETRTVIIVGGAVPSALSTSTLRLSATEDVTLSSTGHAFQIGADTGPNLAFDSNEIQARNNGAVSELNLNNEGGAIQAHNASGFTVPTPTAATHAARKDYVDAKTWDAATDLTGTLADGNLPSRLKQIAATVTDWNNAVTSGWYKANNASNAPGASSWYYGMVLGHSDTNYVKQVGYDYFADRIYTRTRNNGTWSAWRELHTAAYDFVDSTSYFSYTTGWSNAGGWDGVRMSRYGNVVTLYGACQKTSFSSGELIGTITSSGLRPAYRTPGTSNNAAGISIYSSGSVYVDFSGTGGIRINASWIID